ncbi:hypothetical protein LWI29_032271 [Acer saccharum]|uniref:CCHC-type domain-containing protein n=1 Tax=Acer saccharum TaxID=4024 RepID=A0AA39TNV7_ACESA|nr:hypothetical protein LWI29_032271 [Acer saccharum]
MDAQEIVKLCESLSLVEDVGAIRHVEEELQSEGLKDVSHVLVGKVLTGRKVNREGFIGLIEQLWSPIGRVETESVGENIFMFYFRNAEDRNRIWQRGPWHFDNSLIVLEKPDKLGDISTLKFNQADFWVQIHNIPIMCMNRRMARWLANQLGEVLELPSDSKECWGKFLRVKVRIDLSRPLERWLRLRLDNAGKVVVVVLKYERLPEFCYACGKIGHALRDCHDDEARMNAMEGATASYGAWMRAAAPDRQKMKNSQTEKGESSGKGKSERESGGTSANQNLGSKFKPPESTGVGEDDVRCSDGTQSLVRVSSSPSQGREARWGSQMGDQMAIDGLRWGPNERLGDLGQISTPTPPSCLPVQHTKMDPTSERVEMPVFGTSISDIDMNGVGSPPKQSASDEERRNQRITAGKKWKRAAREIKSQQIPVRLTSPLSKMLALNQKSRGNSKRNLQSPKLKSPIPKVSPKSHNRSSSTSPASMSKATRFDSETNGVKCKRKVDFLTEEELKLRKKSKLLEDSGKANTSAEPVEQARREQ